MAEPVIPAAEPAEPAEPRGPSGPRGSATSGGPTPARELRGARPMPVREPEKEHAILADLVTLAGTSAIAGGLSLAYGLRRSSPPASAFGRQTLAGALVEGSVAGLAWVRRPVRPARPVARARKVRAILAGAAVANAAAAGGALAVVLSDSPRDQGLRGAALAAAAQSLVLAALCTRHAVVFHALVLDGALRAGEVRHQRDLVREEGQADAHGDR